MGRPKTGWGDIDEKTIIDAYNEILVTTRTEVFRAVYQGMLEIDQLDLNHEVMKRLAKRFGWRYRR